MPKLLTTEEAASFLGYSAATLNQARSTGMLSGRKAPKFFKIGTKLVRYTEEDLTEWLLESSEVKTETDKKKKDK